MYNGKLNKKKTCFIRQNQGYPNANIKTRLCIKLNATKIHFLPKNRNKIAQSENNC